MTGVGLAPGECAGTAPSPGVWTGSGGWRVLPALVLAVVLTAGSLLLIGLFDGGLLVTLVVVAVRPGRRIRPLWTVVGGLVITLLLLRCLAGPDRLPRGA